LGAAAPISQRFDCVREIIHDVIVVEGESDRVAIEALAERRGLKPARAGVEVVALGGAHRIGSFVAELDPAMRSRVVGLCDAGEEHLFLKALGPDRFFVCDADLEDELIRALGVEAVEEVIQANGDLKRLRALQQMPAWRERANHEQLRRFFGSGAHRKIRYARLLVDALDLERVPRPLDGVLDAWYE
jgi:hypothetical protein